MVVALLAAISLDSLFAAPTLRGSHIGALVVSADTGAVVYSRNADDAYMPASTMKLLVGSAALDELGNAFSFVTTVSTDGTNLYVRGGGDPTLNAGDLDDAASALRALNATSFSGMLDGDISAIAAPRYPDGWAVDDLANDYAAPPSALSFADNALHIVAHPGSTAGAPVTLSVTPASAAFHIENDATTGAAHSDDTSNLELTWSQPNTLRVIGSVPLDEHDSQLDAAMLDPPAVTLDLFAQDFARDGITVGAQAFAAAPPDARVLWNHHSAALPQLLAAMWPPSDNLIAESLLDALGAGQNDARAAGIAREIAWLRSVNVEPETLTIVDGSGLSAYDRVTPRALVAILRHDWSGSSREIVKSALAQPGKPGTLEHVFIGTPLVGRLFAKTGTVNHTRTLAGYLLTSHGTLAFALLINDWIDPSNDASAHLRAYQQAFLEALL